MTPPQTGRASTSLSNWRAVPELETMLCHPDIAPQAMVTNMMGHSGPIGMEKSVKAGRVKSGRSTNIPIIPKNSPRKTI